MKDTAALEDRQCRSRIGSEPLIPATTTGGSDPSCDRWCQLAAEAAAR